MTCFYYSNVAPRISVHLLHSFWEYCFEYRARIAKEVDRDDPYYTEYKSYRRWHILFWLLLAIAAAWIGCSSNLTPRIVSPALNIISFSLALF